MRHIKKAAIPLGAAPASNMSICWRRSKDFPTVIAIVGGGLRTKPLLDLAWVLEESCRQLTLSPTLRRTVININMGDSSLGAN